MLQQVLFKFMIYTFINGIMLFVLFLYQFHRKCAFKEALVKNAAECTTTGNENRSAKDEQANARNGLIDGYFIEWTFSSFEKKFNSFFSFFRSSLHSEARDALGLGAWI